MSATMRRRSILKAAAGLLLSAPLAAIAAGIEINGAGSSFVNLVMQRWIKLLPASLGVKANYTVLGTGTAQTRVLSGDMDFAAMEIALPAENLASGNMIQFPVAFGALAMVHNIPGIKDGQLQLNGPLLAAIYSGGIKKWNDPKIAAANPGVSLPDHDIVPVHLGAPGGTTVFSTTFAFTQYLLATNADWRAKYGAAITKRWAIGSMVTTADSMVETLKAIPGCIGYVALGTALTNGLPMAMLQNKAGRPVQVSAASLQAAVSQVDWSKTPGLVANLIDLPGADTWPLVLASYALVQRDYQDKARGEAIQAFFRFIVTEGAEAARQSNALPLPASLQAAVLAQMGKAGG